MQVSRIRRASSWGEIKRCPANFVGCIIYIAGWKPILLWCLPRVIATKEPGAGTGTRGRPIGTKNKKKRPSKVDSTAASSHPTRHSELVSQRMYVGFDAVLLGSGLCVLAREEGRTEKLSLKHEPFVRWAALT